MSETPLRSDEGLRRRLHANLAAFERRACALDGLRAAAVALALVADADERPCFVLTRRAAKLRSHGGQWALPISTSFVVLSYIPEAFDAAGLAYPSASWTLDDLDNAARTLTQYNADGSIAMPGLTVQGFGGGSVAPLFLSLLGQGVYSDAAFPSSPDFSSPQLETYLDTWLQMVNDGLLDIPEGVDNANIPMILGTPFGGGPFGLRLVIFVLGMDDGRRRDGKRQRDQRQTRFHKLVSPF